MRVFALSRAFVFHVGAALVIRIVTAASAASKRPTSTRLPLFGRSRSIFCPIMLNSRLASGLVEAISRFCRASGRSYTTSRVSDLE